jgi:hypothetical protein
MPVPLAFLSLLSGAPAALKFAQDSVDFYQKVKGLRSPSPPRPLAESESLTKIERTQLKNMYVAIEDCRPVAAQIAARALRFYLAVGVLSFGVLFVLSGLLILVLRWGWILTIVCILIGSPFIITILGLRNPARIMATTLESARLNFERVTPSLGNSWSKVKSDLRASVGWSGISIPERAFLELYSKAEALVRLLECDILVQKLQCGIAAAYETHGGRIFETGIEIILDLAQKGRLDSREHQANVLKQEFSAAGLDSLVNPDFVDPEFFRVDFRSLAQNKENLKRHLALFWPFKR